MDKKLLWEKAAAFHGHECPGLTIGYRASLYAIRLLDLTFSDDEQVVCIAENDACGCDAIQAILGCSIGKGNLLFHLRGKQAFSFYHRTTGRSVRLVLRPRPQGLSRDQAFAYYHSCTDEEMFQVKEATIPLPERAKLFDSCICDCCGEQTGTKWIRMDGDRRLCLDCYESYATVHTPADHHADRLGGCT